MSPEAVQNVLREFLCFIYKIFYNILLFAVRIFFVKKLTLKGFCSIIYKIKWITMSNCAVSMNKA